MNNPSIVQGKIIIKNKNKQDRTAACQVMLHPDYNQVHEADISRFSRLQLIVYYKRMFPWQGHTTDDAVFTSSV